MPGSCLSRREGGMCQNANRYSEAKAKTECRPIRIRDADRRVGIGSPSVWHRTGTSTDIRGFHAHPAAIGPGALATRPELELVRTPQHAQRESDLHAREVRTRQVSKAIHQAELVQASMALWFVWKNLVVNTSTLVLQCCQICMHGAVPKFRSSSKRAHHTHTSCSPMTTIKGFLNCVPYEHRRISNCPAELLLEMCTASLWVHAQSSDLNETIASTL